MSVALDAVTGLPLDDSYLTQYQIPLGSQPINLEELGALGRQSNWLYPDNLPGVVSRLQARDNTNPLNAQDLSTDGARNLNVNIAKSNVPSGGSGPITLLADPWIGTISDTGTGWTTVTPDVGVPWDILYGWSCNVAWGHTLPSGNDFQILFRIADTVNNKFLFIASLWLSDKVTKDSYDLSKVFDRGINVTASIGTNGNRELQIFTGTHGFGCSFTGYIGLA